MARDVIDASLLKDKSVQAWMAEQGQAFVSEFGQEAITAKRQRTMSFEHADMSQAEVFEGLSMGFEGDFEAGTGEIVAVTEAQQEILIETAQKGIGTLHSYTKRGRRGGRKHKRKTA